MSGIATAMVAAAAIGAGSSAYSGHQSRKATKSAAGRLDALQYTEDPDYTETQAGLKKLGLGLLDGNVPDYYKSIGEAGGKEFEDMLGLTTRDIKTAVAESSAASGRARGGNLAAASAGAVADTALKARYEDYNRALSGKESLLNKGISVTEGVRDSAFGEQTQRNELEASKAGAMINLDFIKADARAKEGAGYASSLQSLVSGLWGQGGVFANQSSGAIASSALGSKNQASGVSSLGSIRGSMGKQNPSLYDKMYGL